MRGHHCGRIFDLYVKGLGSNISCALFWTRCRCRSYLQTERKQMMQTTTLDGVSRMASRKFLPFDVSLLMSTRWLKAQVKKKTHCRANETKKR